MLLIVNIYGVFMEGLEGKEERSSLHVMCCQCVVVAMWKQFPEADVCFIRISATETIHIFSQVKNQPIRNQKIFLKFNHLSGLLHFEQDTVHFLIFVFIFLLFFVELRVFIGVF